MQIFQERAHDSFVRPLVILASITSLVCTAIFLRMGVTLAYVDAQSHLLISRRIINNITPGYAQNGGVWPDLPHLLASPFTKINLLYETGLAGSYFSMLCFVVSVVYLFKTVVLLTNDSWSGVVAAFVYGANPNVLYMQATAMTELPMFSFFIMAVYYLLRWSMEPEKSGVLEGLETRPNWVPLTLSGLCISLGTHVRYESWILYVVSMIAVLYVSLRYRWGFWKSLAHLILLGFTGGYGIFLWLYYNWRIFQDPLRFMRGDYAASSNWVQPSDRAVGDMSIAIKTYVLAIEHVVGAPMLVLAVVGFCLFLIKERLRPQTVPVLALLFPLVFFPPMLYLAQRPLHVPEINGGMYNLRFALAMQLPVAIMAGFLTYKRVWGKLLVATVIVYTLVTMLPSNIVTLNEPVLAQESAYAKRQREAANFLADNYDGGRILMEGFGNETVNFLSRIPTDQFIYEGTRGYWVPALENPSQFVTWIFARRTPENEDKVWSMLQKHPERMDGYKLVYSNQDIFIFRKT